MSTELMNGFKKVGWLKNLQFFAMVPQRHAYVVEFLGKFQKVLEPGLHFLIPIFQRVEYKIDMRETPLAIHEQEAVTKDNVHLVIDGVLYLRVDDPFLNAYGAQEPINFSYVLAQSLMRAEIGKLTLDETFKERENLNRIILEHIAHATEAWGIKCLRYEIKDIKMEDNFRKVLNLQAESERKKRADILRSEGKRASDIERAEGEKASMVFAAQAQAERIFLRNQALALRIKEIRSAIESEHGEEAAAFLISENYLEALSNLSKANKDIILKVDLAEPETQIKNALDMMRLKTEAETSK